ncbi:hypothetical protein [Aquimarina algiphila]|uniref:Lipoprotein n=1 Tax=Aquimarina algiphila TaxID=2047982 RepID=A0A554VQ79_9FLAO|nr:hypothetical protein [Aquimarina algiphila]TSE10684.1 hypothetical protein FOF46_03635 [Aquimarina algiphila]
MNTKTSSILFLLTWGITMFITSCRSESDELLQDTNNQYLSSDSKIAGLILRAVTNDGSVDDSIDKASCFSIKFPFTITANSQVINYNTIDDIAANQGLFNDTDPIVFSFPITLIFNDFTEIAVNDDTQLQGQVNNCNGQNDSIACIDFEYPLSASGFDSQNELILKVDFENDKDFYDFIDGLNRNDFVNLDFPMTVLISDGAVLRVSSLGELENTFDDVLRNRCN